MDQCKGNLMSHHTLPWLFVPMYCMCMLKTKCFVIVTMLSLLAQETHFVHFLNTNHTFESCAFTTITYTHTSCFIAQKKVHSLLTPLTAHRLRGIHSDSDIVCSFSQDAHSR